MSKFEERVFTNKLEALFYNRKHGGQFFEATVPYKEPEKLYIVAVSRHRAQMAMVDYLMDLTKWPKKKQDDHYIAALEDEMAKTDEEQSQGEDSSGA